MRDQIFISYSRQDQEWLERLQARLEPLVRDNEELSLWVDSKIDVGADYRKEIKRAIRSSKVAVLLVSNSYLRSPFIAKHEFSRVLKAARRRGIRVFWIAVRESGYWKFSALERYQAANNPERPLASLGTEELDKELENISEKVLSAARLPIVKKGPLYYLNLLPFLGMVAIPVSSFIHLILRRELSPTIVIVLFSLFCLWITVLAIVARRAFYSEPVGQIPAPEVLWEIIFNKLGKAVIEMFNPDPTVQILVISDNSTQEQAELIRQHYTDKSLSIVNVACASKLEQDKKDELSAAFRRSSALYVFWTDTIKANWELRRVILDWALRESHKPVLVVNFIPEQEYDFPFTFIPQGEIASGMWRLLARSTERANEWRMQSERSSRILVGSIGLIIVFCIALLATFDQLRNAAAELERRESIDENNLRSFSHSLGSVRTAFGNLFSDEELEAFLSDKMSADEFRSSLKDILKKRSESREQALKKVPEVLKRFATYSLNDLLRGQTTDNITSSELTFWRKGNPESDGQSYVYQVAWSGDRAPKRFPVRKVTAIGTTMAHIVGDGTVIGTAIDHKAFVVWRDDFRSNDPASWLPDGVVLGRWDGNAKIIRLNDGCTIDYRATSAHKRKGIICLGVETPNTDVVSGVCLDMPAQPGFLEKAWTRNYLLRTTSVLHVLPNELLITKELRDQIAAEEALQKQH